MIHLLGKIKNRDDDTLMAILYLFLPSPWLFLGEREWMKGYEGVLGLVCLLLVVVRKERWWRLD